MHLTNIQIIWHPNQGQTYVNSENFQCFKSISTRTQNLKKICKKWYSKPTLNVHSSLQTLCTLCRFFSLGCLETANSPMNIEQSFRSIGKFPFGRVILWQMATVFFIASIVTSGVKLIFSERSSRDIKCYFSQLLALRLYYSGI